MRGRIISLPTFNESGWQPPSMIKPARVTPRPALGNANFTSAQHLVHHPAPNGIVGLVLTNRSMPSKTSGKGNIRKALMGVDLVDCVIVLPDQLFQSILIPARLWSTYRGRGRQLRR